MHDPDSNHWLDVDIILITTHSLTLDCPVPSSLSLDIVGLGVGGSDEMVASSGVGRLGPRASSAAQERAAGHSEEATSPADEHCFTKLYAAKKTDTHI